MAGGKETPRQKMVGLMYLVLLALLALQVGAEIMVKFQQLNYSMETLVTESTGKASLTLEAIATKAKEDGRPEIVELEKIARELNSTSTDIIAYIKSLKDEIIAKTDGYVKDDQGNDTSVPLGMKNTDVPSMILVGTGEGAKGKGKGYDLEIKLDSYIDELNKANAAVAKALNKPVDKTYESMTLDGKEDPLFKKDEDQKGKDWVHLAFDHAPQIAALAFLTEKQARVANYQAEILSKIQKSLGASDVSFDEIFPMAAAESNVVAAGTDYEAKLFITARSSAESFKPTMTMNGGAIKVDNGEGTVKFKASLKGGKPVKGNKDMVSKTWKGVIKMKDGTGKEVTYTKDFTYFVSKPVMQIQSASVSALYKNCGNELNVQVPALGENYNPVFGVTGGSKIKGAKKGLVTIVPTSPSVKLSVSSGGQLVGSQQFKVRLVPKPDIVAYANGKPVDQKRGMKAPGPRSISIKAIADKSFAEFLPKDARYRVVKWEALLVRGKRPVATKKFTSPDGNIATFASKAKPGDRILIEVLRVVRRNFQGKTETVSIPTTIMNIPLND